MTTAPLSRLLILILAALLNGSPSMAKSSERSGLRKLQQEHYKGIEKDDYNDGDVAFHHRGSGRGNRRDQRDALHLFADVAWEERVANGVFDALDKDSDGVLRFCELREMFLDRRVDLLVLYLNQVSLVTGGVGFTEEDFDLQNLLDEGQCPDRNGFSQAGQPSIIPNDDQIFPFGVIGFLKSSWWGFMQEGLGRINPSTGEFELIDSDGFLQSYTNEEWHNAFPAY